MRLSRTPPWWTLPVLMLLAVSLRLLCWSRALMMMNDGVDFLWQAEQLLAGDLDAMLAHPYHPLYGALSAGAALLTGDVLSGALTISIGSGLALVATSWWLARRLLPEDPWAPAAAGFVASICARAVQYGGDVQSDGLAAALWLLALAALLAAWRGRRPLRSFALAGALTGLGYLTRPEMLAAALPACVVLATCAGWRVRLRGAVAFALPLLALMLPYVFALHAASGVWGLSLKPALQLPGADGERYIHQAPPESPMGAPIVFRDRERFRAAAAAELTTPDAAEHEDASVLGARGTPLSEASASTTEDFLRAARLELLLLVGLGVASVWRRARPLIQASSLALGTWLAVALAQNLLNGYVTNRHLLPAIVTLLPLAGAGLLVLIRGRWPLRTLLVLVLWESYRAGTEAQRSDHDGRLAALAWLGEHTAPEERFATQRKRDGWYADRPILVCEFPADEARLRQLIAEHDVRWFIFDERRVQRWHPEWLRDGQLEEWARFGEGEDVALVLRPHFDA